MAMLAHNTSRYGATAGFLTVIGVDLGETCLLGGTFAGLTLSSDLLPLFFRWVSLAGAPYLVWLAAEAFLVRRRTSSKPDSSRRAV
jgi:threonine/homoserine/homoserine lactone efflux protein